MSRTYDYATNRDKNRQQFWQTIVGDRLESIGGLPTILSTYNQPAKASAYYRHLFKNRQNGAHSNRPELARARNLLAQEGVSK
jgi:hypothetical protein